jgi:hypothetical protein
MCFPPGKPVTSGATCTLGQAISAPRLREDWGAQWVYTSNEKWGLASRGFCKGWDSAARHTHGRKQSIGGKCSNGSGRSHNQRSR